MSFPPAYIAMMAIHSGSGPIHALQLPCRAPESSLCRLSVSRVHASVCLHGRRHTWRSASSAELSEDCDISVETVAVL
eukprot:7815687-Lingulodinium_polyedra.AAC.1